MIHARPDYNRIQDPALADPSLLAPGTRPIAVDEPVFLLRASDKTAADTVRCWVMLNEHAGNVDRALLILALRHADVMDEWKDKKLPDGPKLQ